MSGYRYFLCDSQMLDDPGSYGFSLTDDGSVDVFLVKMMGTVRGYKNRCPHTGAPLEWKPHQFLSLDQSMIQCALHGALFSIDQGLCLRGPCLGEALQQLNIEVDNKGRVFLLDQLL